MNKTKNKSLYWNWMPAAFALAGIITFIFASFGPPASSSGFVSTLKGLLQNISTEYVESKEHYMMIPGTGSWLFAFVLGMAIGGFIGARTLAVSVKDIPDIWEKRFGPEKYKRYTAAFAGGFLILFASRLAGGCTLGLFISGSTQLAVSGIWFGVLIFAFAMITSRLVYAKVLNNTTGKEEK